MIKYRIVKDFRKKEERQVFEKGEYVVYGQNGICEVEDITYLNLGDADEEKLYYVLAPVEVKGSKIYSPVDNTKIIIRRIISKEEAMSLLDEIEAIEELWIINDKLREKQYKEAMQSCDYREWIRIIKTSYLRKCERTAEGKKITTTDEKYLKLAENNLYGELALALDKEKSEMENFIIEYVEKQKK